MLFCYEVIQLFGFDIFRQIVDLMHFMLKQEVACENKDLFQSGRTGETFEFLNDCSIFLNIAGIFQLIKKRRIIEFQIEGKSLGVGIGM